MDGQFLPGGQQLPQLIRQTPRSPWHKRDIKEIITGMGLSASLKLALDAGDATSLPAASTKWIDLSGNGYDFFRGTTAASEATDPAINGSAGGLSSSEYLSFDGGDVLKYDTTNETWMNNIHKDGAKFWGVMSLYGPAALGTISGICGTNGNDVGLIGFRINLTAVGTLQANVTNASGTAAATRTSSGSFPITAAAWNFIGWTWDEASDVISFNINGGRTDNSAWTYTSPSASNASYTMNIGAQGNDTTSVELQSGIRLGFCAMGEGTALTGDELDSIFRATRGRYGV